MPRFDGMNAFIRADIENLSASLLLPPNSWRWKVTVYKLEETFYCSRGVGQRERSKRFYTKSYKRNLLARRRAGSPASPSPGLTSNSLTMQMTRKSPNPLWTTTELLRCFSAVAHFSVLTSILWWKCLVLQYVCVPAQFFVSRQMNLKILAVASEPWCPQIPLPVINLAGTLI